MTTPPNESDLVLDGMRRRLRTRALDATSGAALLEWLTRYAAALDARLDELGYKRQIVYETLCGAERRTPVKRMPPKRIDVPLSRGPMPSYSVDPSIERVDARLMYRTFIARDIREDESAKLIEYVYREEAP